MKIRLLLLVFIGVLNFGMNPVAEKYKTSKQNLINKNLEKKDIQILKSDNIDNDYRDLFSEGYEILGYSDFESFEISTSSMKSQAKKTGSELVIYSEQFKNQKASMEWDPFAKRNRCYSSRSIFEDCDRGEWVYIYKDYYSYNILFLNKVKLNGLGLLVEELSVEKRKEIESNYGLEILSIRKDSDAYKENVLPNDIITKINDNKILTKQEYEKILLDSKGEKIDLEIFRKGKIINKQIIVY